MLMRRRLTQLVGLAALAAVGCSGGGGNGTLATVSGTVTHEGKPVEGAKVNFYSTVESGGQKGNAYSAQTDSNGKYAIITVGKEPGIPAGMYKVTVTKLDIKGNLPPDFDAGQMEASGMARNTLPKDYESVASTKLSATLQPGKNEKVDFELKGKAAPAGKGAPQGTP